MEMSHIPPNYVVACFSCSSKATRGEDLQVEHPVWCGYSPPFHFYPTLAGMLGPTLIRDEVVQVGEPGEKRLLATTWMVKPLHHKQLPVDGVMRLIKQGAGDRHLRVFEHRRPPRLLLLEPAPNARAIGSPRCGYDVIGKVA